MMTMPEVSPKATPNSREVDIRSTNYKQHATSNIENFQETSYQEPLPSCQTEASPTSPSNLCKS
jgi:hypothetical protein